MTRPDDEKKQQIIIEYCWPQKQSYHLMFKSEKISLFNHFLHSKKKTNKIKVFIETKKKFSDIFIYYLKCLRCDLDIALWFKEKVTRARTKKETYLWNESSMDKID